MSLSIRGLASGLDIDNIIEELIRIESRPIINLEEQKNEHQVRIDTWRDINNRLYNLRQMGAPLLYAESFAPMIASSSQAAVATALAAQAGEEGLYHLDISQIALYHRVASEQVEATTVELGLAGRILINDVQVEIEATDSLALIRDRINDAYGLKLNYHNLIEVEEEPALQAAALTEGVTLLLSEGEEESVTVEVDSEGNYTITVTYLAEYTAQDIYNQIDNHASEEGPKASELIAMRLFNETALADAGSFVLEPPLGEGDAGVKASVIDNRLILESTTIGSPGEVVLDDHNDVLLSLGIIDGAGGYANEIQAAQDALFKLDGLEIEYTSNTVDDIVEGITFSLHDTGTAWIEVGREYERILEGVRGFVDQFNSTYQFIREKQERGATLQGDPVLMRIELETRRLLMDTVGINLNEGINQAAVVGFSIDWETGLLEYDESKFLQQLQENPEAVQALFQGREKYETVISNDQGVGLLAAALGESVRLNLQKVSAGSETGVSVALRDDGTYRIDVSFHEGTTAREIYDMITLHKQREDEPARAADLLRVDLLDGSMAAADTSLLLAGDGFNGIARRLDGFLERTLRSGEGTIALRSNYYSTLMHDLDYRIDRVYERVERTRARLVRQFTALETMLGEMMSQGEWLTQQIRTLEGFYTRRD